MEQLKKKALFNEHGDIEVTKRRMINGNTTNLNDFNNMKYPWVSDWYRQAMNNFWVPEEINLNQDVKDYRRLSKAEKTAYEQDPLLPGLPRFPADGQPSQRLRLHHRQRGQSLSDDPGVSGGAALPELQLHAGYDL